MRLWRRDVKQSLEGAVFGIIVGLAAYGVWSLFT